MKSIPSKVNSVAGLDTASVLGLLKQVSPKTGFGRFCLVTKRNFHKAWMREETNQNKPKKQAMREYEAYREQALDNLNDLIGNAFLSRQLYADSILFDRAGNLRIVNLVRVERRSADIEKAFQVLSQHTGCTVEYLKEQALKKFP